MIYCKVLKTPMVFVVVGLMTASTSAALADASEERTCSVHYQGETSRIYSCDDGSFGWTMPRDAFRIDKPLQPGPNALPNEVKRKLIDKPAKHIAKIFGW